MDIIQRDQHIIDIRVAYIEGKRRAEREEAEKTAAAKKAAIIQKQEFEQIVRNNQVVEFVPGSSRHVTLREQQNR